MPQAPPTAAEREAQVPATGLCGAQLFDATHVPPQELTVQLVIEKLPESVPFVQVRV